MVGSSSPASLPVSTGLSGRELAPIDWSWTPQQTILYALGVGAQPPRDLPLLDESDGEGPAVLPGFGTIPTGIGVMPLIAELGLDVKQLLHAGQSIRLHRPLQPTGHATLTRQITEVWDKGNHALITIEEHATDDGGRPLLTARSSWFVRDAGGFGGERGPSSVDATSEPRRPPDRAVQKKTTPEQAALYRLSGDRNPVHINPPLARSAGYDVPILHGLCTLGIAALEVGAAMFGTKRYEIRELHGRFVAPVMPGDALNIVIWHGAEHTAHFQVDVGRKPVLVDGLLSR